MNIENIDKPLRNGKKKANKNRYYYYKDQYYIIELTKGQWMISEDSTKTRELLRNIVGMWEMVMRGQKDVNIGIN